MLRPSEQQSKAYMTGYTVVSTWQWFNTTMVNLAGKPSIEIITIILIWQLVCGLSCGYNVSNLKYKIARRTKHISLPAYRDCKHLVREENSESGFPYKVVMVLFSNNTNIYTVRLRKRRNISYQRWATFKFNSAETCGNWRDKLLW